MFNRDYEINEKQVADFLENATNKVKTTEDVDTLSELTKLFKKNVPLSLRKYVIAYMLKELLKHYRSFGGNNRRNENKNERNDRSERNSRNKNEYKQNNKTEKAAATTSAAEKTTTEEERPRHPRVEIPEDQAVSIFISIGKNRRVFPRDLVGILISIAGLDRERIGDIKVLANYSFVQLYSDDAPIAIEKLNGYDYRGRKLAVSYSRQKDEEDTTEDAQTSTEESEMSAEMAAEDAAAYAAAEKAAADKEPFGL